MTLAELLEEKFRGDIRFRGMAYLQAERVAVTRVMSDHVFGLVRDGVEYETQLSRTDGQLKMHCNCKAGNQPEPACKHLWATILAVDESGLLAASLKHGYVPPFTAEVPSRPLDESDWDDEFELGMGLQTRSKNKKVEVQERLRPWETQLRELRQKMQSNEPTAPSAGREREIFYEVDIASSREVGQLVLQTSQRQRRANGQWGKLKPLKLRPGKLEEIEHNDDRRILAHLSGATSERTNWYAQQSEIQTSTHRYRVPHELCELILPQMCQTCHVRCLDSSEREDASLEWDDGPPWELTIRVVLDETKEEWRLKGELRREDEVLPVEAVQLLVPGGLVVTRNHIARLRDFGAFEWVSLLDGKEPLEVPVGDEHELVEQILDIPALPRLELPKELQLEEIECDPSPCLTLRTPPGARWHRERLHGEVTFDYLGTMVSGASIQWAVVQRDQSRCLIRNRDREDRAWSELQENGFRRLLDQQWGRHDVEINARDLGSAVRKLIELGWQVQADGKQVRQPAGIQFRIESGIDWFELHADVNFEGHGALFPELLSALARGDSTIRLDDGSLGILPEEWARQYGLLGGLGTADGDHVRFGHNQVALLDALLASQESFDFDEKYREVREQFSGLSGVDAIDEPAGFHGELRGYQREGLGWLEFLQRFQFGGCLADDMGLGKTVQILALMLDRSRAVEKLPPTLIVVPKSLIFNWREECNRFTPELSVLEYTGLDRAALRTEFGKYNLIVTTYGTLRRDIIFLKDIPFDYVVLDEAQTIKNSGSQIAKASRLLQANYRMALSGTPIENHLGDLWSIFEFLNPGMLGRSSLFKTFAADAEDKSGRELLSNGLRPFILRRTKKEVASELPEKIEQTIYCDMGEEQQRLYSDLRDHYRDSLLGLVAKQGLSKSKMHVLEALLRLRQAACHQALLDNSLIEKSSAKLDVLCPHLEELIDEGHKALVFSQFTSMLTIVRHHLDQRGIAYEYLDGKTRNRKQVVDRFQNDPGCGAFLISLKAGGLGLNLTAADYVFLLDPWWNPAVEAQAIDRAHRLGQTRRVIAYRLICRNTVEEKIAKLQEKKRSLADAILKADSSMLKDLSSEDLEMLLS